MFHPRVTAAKLSALIDAERAHARAHSRPFPSQIHARPPSEVREWTERLAEAAPDASSPLARPLERAETDFITSELLLCRCDFTYWAERYAHIVTAGSRRIAFSPNSTQRLILRRFARLELEVHEGAREDGILADLLKARQLGGCLDPETLVLTADMRWIPIDQVLIGQELVALAENCPGGKGASRKMRRAVVEDRRDIYEPVYKLTFDNGQSIKATGDHRFLFRRRGGVETRWFSVRDARIGDRIRCGAPLWSTPDPDDGWMGGMLDGEGSLRAKTSGGGEVTISQVAGPVLDRCAAYMRRSGFFFRDEIDNRQSGERSKLGNKPVHKLVINRIDDIFRLIGQTRPTRFVGSSWWEGKELHGKKQGNPYATIVSIELLPVQRVVDLQTSTGTYMAAGLVSHNSTLAELVIVHRATLQANRRALVASDVPNPGTVNLFQMFTICYDNLPWFMRPPTTQRVESFPAVLAFGHKTVVQFGASKSTRGKQGERGQIGRSGTYSLLHLSELSTWSSASQIDSALMPAVPENDPEVFALFESTAKGENSWWQRHWNQSKAGITRFTPIFIPWYAEPAKYRRRPGLGWTPRPSTLAHAQKVWDTSPQWMEGQHYRLTPDQMYWYETRRAQYEANGELRVFLEEFPADDVEAFQATSNTVFSAEVIQRIGDLAALRPLRALVEIAPAHELQRAHPEEVQWTPPIET